MKLFNNFYTSINNFKLVREDTIAVNRTVGSFITSLKVVNGCPPLAEVPKAEVVEA